MPTPTCLTKIDASKPFQFLEVLDCGPDSGACCPHCGAEGRYIYSWAEFGQVRSAMAGCYAALTGHLKLNEVDQFIQTTMDKVARKKPLSGWNKTVLRMLEYADTNKADQGKVDWAWGKIKSAVIENKQYAFRKFRH